MKVLIDAMRDGIDKELIEHDYEAYSVKKLCEEEKMKLWSDFSVIKHAQRMNMVLITEDDENISSCTENKIDCIRFGQEQTIEYLISELDKIRNQRKKLTKEKLKRGFRQFKEGFCGKNLDGKGISIPVKYSRAPWFVTITAIGVIVESFYVYLFLNSAFPNLKQIGNLESLFVEIGIAIFITVTVYEYSTKSERQRKMRLRRQIISSFEMLCAYFAWLATQRASQSVNEEFIMKKNLRVFHIQNLIGVLPEKIGTELSIKIPELCEKALLSPRIIKPLDTTQLISVDYTECEAIILDTNVILQNLRDKWKIRMKA